MNKPLKIVILFFLLGLIGVFLAGAHAVFYDKGDVKFSEKIFFIFFGIIGIISFLLGFYYCWIQKSWDLKNFCLRIQNIYDIEYVLMMANKRKEELEKEKNDR